MMRKQPTIPFQGDSSFHSSQSKSDHDRIIATSSRENIKPTEQRLSTGSVHSGSHSKRYKRSLGSLHHSVGHGTPSRNASLVQLDGLLQNVDAELDSFGIQEQRDGFFDPTFYRPFRPDHSEMTKKAFESLPVSLQTHVSFSALLRTLEIGKGNWDVSQHQGTQEEMSVLLP